jgi:uncharacterized protein YdeI (YjbR/CyaY-like superfamily)
MAPVVPDPAKIRAFADRAALEAWMRENHDRASEIWLKLHKKGSGLASVSSTEAVEVALCWGWIDGIRKAGDDKSFLQRLTPRGRKSIWSQVNREKVERLTREGRMTPHGQKQVDAAKADGRWEQAYPSAKTMQLPDDLLAAVEAEPQALQTLQRLNAQNRYALAFRLHQIKTPAGRAKRIAAFVEMLKRGESIYPQPGAAAQQGAA